MWDPRTARRIYTLTLLVVAIVASPPSGRADEPPTPIDVFISPYCGLSVARIADAVPKLGAFGHSKNPLRFNLIPMGAGGSEELHLRELVCADQQGALPPMFLFIANTAHAGQEPRPQRFLEELGINREKFTQCLKDPSYTRDVLAASSERFWGSGLRGVPSVKFGKTTFTLTNFDLLLALRGDSEASAPNAL